MIPRSGRVLGVDWGEVRIGLALSDETQLLASPLETLSRRPGRRFPMLRFFFQIVAILSAAALFCRGDIVTLKSGEKIDGRILSETSAESKACRWMSLS